MTSMTNDFTEVLPTSQARAELSTAVARFRREGVSSAPVIFGSHRKPEGVVLPFELFEQLIPAIEDILLAVTIRARLANPAPSVPLEDLIDELGFSPSEFE
jgi:antitoxin StbD